MEKIWRFIKDEDGMELTEIAVAGALIVATAAGTFILLGEEIVTSIETLISHMTPGGAAS